MSGQSEHARAVALALTFTMIGFAVLKSTDYSSEWVFPSFWQGSLLGGTLFGDGMVLAGGCGAGSIWRAGEGHVKLWLAIFFLRHGRFDDASMSRAQRFDSATGFSHIHT